MYIWLSLNNLWPYLKNNAKLEQQKFWSPLEIVCLAQFSTHISLEFFIWLYEVFFFFSLDAPS